MPGNFDNNDDFDAESGAGSGSGGGKFDPAEFQKFLQQFIDNPQNFDAAELAKAAGLSNDPEQIALMLKQLQAEGAVINQEACTCGAEQCSAHIQPCHLPRRAASHDARLGR